MFTLSNCPNPRHTLKIGFLEGKKIPDSAYRLCIRELYRKQCTKKFKIIFLQHFHFVWQLGPARLCS